MPDPTPQQIAEWNRFTSHWKNKIRPSINQTLALCEFAAGMQIGLTELGEQTDVYTEEDNQKLQKLLSVYNRMDRAIGKVDLGIYGVQFVDNDIDIQAPLSMSSDEYTPDIVTGFEGIGVSIVIGALVVGGIWGISALMDSHDNMIKTMVKLKVLEKYKSVPGMIPQVTEWLNNYLGVNEEKAKEAGLWDQIKGNLGMIAAAIAAGILLFAYMKGKK